MTLLRRFARGERNLSDTRAALWRLALARGHGSGHGPKHEPNRGTKHEPERGSMADGDDAASLLGAFGLDASPPAKAREVRLREHIRQHLENADAEPSSD